jgi:hypothetical protein
MTTERRYSIEKRLFSFFNFFSIVFMNAAQFYLSLHKKIKIHECFSK